MRQSLRICFCCMFLCFRSLLDFFALISISQFLFRFPQTSDLFSAVNSPFAILMFKFRCFIISLSRLTLAALLPDSFHSLLLMWDSDVPHALVAVPMPLCGIRNVQIRIADVDASILGTCSSIHPRCWFSLLCTSNPVTVRVCRWNDVATLHPLSNPLVRSERCHLFFRHKFAFMVVS